jgi:hypothetical protein
MISFIYKIFGDSKDKKNPTVSAPRPQSEAEKMEAELNDIDIKIKGFEEK